jgi:membrane complex biogenesis BtpA family protein
MKLIAVIHVQALPGTPKHRFSPAQIIDQAVKEAEIFVQAGVDEIIIENMHDRPYLNRQVGPEVVAMMTSVGLAVKKIAHLPIGIQILAGANKASLAVAQAAGLDYIRAEGFVFGHVADEGYIDSDAGELLRYRKQIGADHIKVLTDIKKKHSAHAITADVDLAETAHAAEFFLSDGLIVTGTATGKPASLEEVKAVKKAVQIPVFVGSGINDQNIKAFAAVADGLIVGSYFKRDGHWANEVEPGRVRRLADVLRC